MKYTVRFRSRARKEFLALPLRVRRRAAALVEGLAGDPMTGDAKKLRVPGIENAYSIRFAGRYRLLYRVYAESVEIVVVTVGHRRDIYERALRRWRSLP